jgi:transcriptional regulator with XRE-family HTH domain
MDSPPTPGSKPVSEWERQIARRAAAVRRFNGYRQQDVADWLGVTRSWVANVEAGRATMTLKMGWKICETLNVRPEWLLHAGPPQSPFPRLEGELTAFAADYVESFGRVPFTHGCSLLCHILSAPESDPSRAMHLAAWRASEAAPVGVLPVLEDGSPDPADGGPLPILDRPISLNPEDGGLTFYPLPGNLSPVQPIMPKLIERLRHVTAERGRKTELAKRLGVSQQKVSDWLSGRVEPSGETTLRLLEWVTAEEAKTKSPAGASSPAERTAQPRKSSNETIPKTGPPPG